MSRWLLSKDAKRGDGAHEADEEEWKVKAKEKEVDRPEARAVVQRALSPAPSYLTPIIKLYIRVVIMSILQTRIWGSAMFPLAQCNTVSSIAHTLTSVLQLSLIFFPLHLLPHCCAQFCVLQLVRNDGLNQTVLKGDGSGDFMWNCWRKRRPEENHIWKAARHKRERGVQYFSRRQN